MGRHLTELDGLGALRRGKQIEQLLGFDRAGDRRTVRWLTLSPRRDSVGLYEHHVLDDGQDGFIDVTEFSPVDEEEYIGEGRGIGRATTPEEALRLAVDVRARTSGAGSTRAWSAASTATAADRHAQVRRGGAQRVPRRRVRPRG